MPQATGFLLQALLKASSRFLLRGTVSVPGHQQRWGQMHRFACEFAKRRFNVNIIDNDDNIDITTAKLQIDYNIEVIPIKNNLYPSTTL